MSVATKEESVRAPVPASPKALEGTPQAIVQMSVILETLAGMRTTGEASEELGVAPTRYYQLEARALQGMIDALEPRKRGRKRKVEDELAAQRAEAERLHREVLRYQALHRVSQRALALTGKQAKTAAADAKAARPSKPVKKKAVRRRKRSRAERVLGALRDRVRGESEESSPTAPSSGGIVGSPAPSNPGGAKETSDGR